MNTDTSHDPHEDGVAASPIVRVLGYILALVALALILIPPHHFRGFLYGPIAVIGFYYLGRGRRSPNTWWFWLFASLMFIDLSGIEFPIPNNRLPQPVFPRISMILGGCSSAIAALFGIPKFFLKLFRDIRERRPILFGDD